MLAEFNFVSLHNSPPVGGGGLPYERDGDARGKRRPIWAWLKLDLTLKETMLKQTTKQEL